MKPVRDAFEYDVELIQHVRAVFGLSLETRVMDIPTNKTEYVFESVPMSRVTANPALTFRVGSIPITFQNWSYKRDGGEIVDLFLEYHPAIDILFRRVAP